MADELLTVIIPSLNEEHCIEDTVRSVSGVIPTLPMDVQILLIDDGSTDRTREVMERLCAENAHCRMRVNPRNMGVGRSVLSSYEEIPEGSWVTVIPGDNEFRFESIQNFMAVREDADLILGYLQNEVIRPITRRAASFAFAQVVRTVCGLPYRYLNGMKMYRVECFRGIEVVSSGHAYNAELISKAVLRDPFLRVKQVPFVARGRTGGASKAFTPRSISRAVSEFVKGRASVGEYRKKVLGLVE